MGLLDEAIREHLDLKRRRGADPAEIERAERDALGPVRREPEPLGGAGFDGVEPYDLTLGAGHLTAERERDDSYPAQDEYDERYEPLAPHGDPLVEDEEHVDRSARPHGAPPLEPEDFFGQETVEYGIDDEDVPEREPQSGRRGRNDMLEETPEFLQDTPDHDRLWFEQRPPRDFDFDG